MTRMIHAGVPGPRRGGRRPASPQRNDRRREREVSRARRVVALATLPLVVLAACGGSDAVDETGQTAATADTDEAAAPATSVVEPSTPDTDVTEPDPDGADLATTSTADVPETTSAPSTAASLEVDALAAVLATVGEPTARYDDESLWVCRGSVTDGVCTDDLSRTVIGADGSREVVERVAATDPPADCFFVHPTVDGRMEPGNMSLAQPVDAELMATIELVTSQEAAPFSTHCRVFAPLYEQATFGTYDMFGPEPTDLTSEPFETAYAQVLDAFRWYMVNENEGRPIVLLGHSQGAHHLARLTRELFDTSPELADQLAMAALIGAGGYGVNVASGDVVGGTFENVPLCTELADTGCVVAYNSYHVDAPPAKWIAAGIDGTEAACVDPSELAAGSATATESTFDYPVLGFGRIVADLSGIGLGDVTTRFVSYPNAYAAACTSDGTHTWLEIGPADASDPRPAIPIQHPDQTGIGLGLHGVDLQLMSGDLLTLTEAKIAAVLAG